MTPDLGELPGNEKNSHDITIQKGIWNIPETWKDFLWAEQGSGESSHLKGFGLSTALGFNWEMRQGCKSRRVHRKTGKQDFSLSPPGWEQYSSL